MKGLTEKEITTIKEELLSSGRPIFLFDDDADGLSSFLLFYRFVKEGKGVIIKSHPTVDEKFVKSVVDYEADKAFVLDIAILKEDFVKGVKRPVIWIDHHKPLDIPNAQIFNPRKHKKNIVYPVSNICYDVVEQDMWIAMVGCVGDWHIPHFKEAFCKKYPDLLDESITHPGQAMFESKIGKLTKIFNFILKGHTKDVMKCIKVLTRIQTPYEILNKETTQGKFIYERYAKINKGYEELKKGVTVTDDPFIIFTYPDTKMSFTGELANELLYKHPDKMIIIAREKDGDMRMSLRSKDIIIPPILEKSLMGLSGKGGGHEHACGASVAKEDFEQFISNLRESLK